MSNPINRITLFKITHIADQEKILAAYKTLSQTAKRNGKAYIKSVTAGRPFDNQRAQGYTVAVFSVFDSWDDMKYYEDECDAHAALKKVTKSVHQGVIVVYFESNFE